jgi:membrane protein DedA with SNARE-associated domain
MDWFNSLLTTITTAVAQNSFAALATLFLVAMLTEIGMPFPFIIDGALLVASYENGLLSFHVLFVIVALTLGRLVGATAIYWLSRFAGDKFIGWLARRFPKLKLLEKMAWLNARLHRHAMWAVAVARLTPGLLTPSTVAAGCSGVKYYRLVLGIILASIIADGALVIVGVITKYGLTFLGFTPSTWEVLLALAAVIFLIWFFRWLWTRYRARKKLAQKK